MYVDYTPASATSIARDVLDRAPETYQRMVAIKSVLAPHSTSCTHPFHSLWKPLSAPSNDWPLALCDARSIAPEDCVAADAVRRGRVGEHTRVYYNVKHKWFYVDKMQRDEILVFRQVDTEVMGGGGELRFETRRIRCGTADV
jgi:hypothetical protein